MWIVVFFGVALTFRLWTLRVSMANERLLKAQGGIEYGKRNSVLLAAMHTLFYLAAIVESAVRKPAFDLCAIIGMILYLGGAAVLLIVIHALGRLWTVKLILASDHKLCRHPIFRLVRHPNYLLGLIPELLGLGLALHAFCSLTILGTLYVLPLVLRIKEENSIMKGAFASY
jgi:isoprenylcysteine carboxyl methyltransferase (ICMT) family protein YpbQ